MRNIKTEKKVRKFFGVVIISNYDNPVPIEATDRRYFVPVFSLFTVPSVVFYLNL